MKGLTLTAKEQTRLQVLNTVLEGRWSMGETAEVLGVSERQGWRLLAAYRKEGAAALAHGNRGRVPWNATPVAMRQQVVVMVQECYRGINHTHLAELLAQREGIVLSRSTVRRFLRSRSAQPATQTTAAPPMPAPTHATGGDAATTGWQPPLLAGGAGARAHPASGGG